MQPENLFPIYLPLFYHRNAGTIRSFKKRKKRKLIRRYVDKTGGNENWIISFRFVCSVDFTQKFSKAGKMSMF